MLYNTFFNKIQLFPISHLFTKFFIYNAKKIRISSLQTKNQFSSAIECGKFYMPKCSFLHFSLSKNFCFRDIHFPQTASREARFSIHKPLKSHLAQTICEFFKNFANRCFKLIFMLLMFSWLFQNHCFSPFSASKQLFLQFSFTVQFFTCQKSHSGQVFEFFWDLPILKCELHFLVKIFSVSVKFRQHSAVNIAPFQNNCLSSHR